MDTELPCNYQSSVPTLEFQIQYHQKKLEKDVDYNLSTVRLETQPEACTITNGIDDIPLAMLILCLQSYPPRAALQPVQELTTWRSPTNAEEGGAGGGGGGDSDL
jgi:hypothetical protein